MHILNARREKVELVPVADAVAPEDPAATGPIVRGLASPMLLSDMGSVGHIRRAANVFFGMGRTEGKSLIRSGGARAAAFKESKTGLLRTVYKEIVVRFAKGTSEKVRESILKKHGFEVARVNRFIRDQVVVQDPQSAHFGELLLDIANDWATMKEVVFATPNFVSQYKRHASAVLPQQWHLDNRAMFAGQRLGEDVRALSAWKKTRGKQSVVIAVLDDGVDVDHPNLSDRIHRVNGHLGRDFYLPDDHPEHFDPRPKRFQYPYDQMTGNDIHGTCCAGVIAADGEDGGASGIAPNCRLLAVKIFHADDLASDERVADAIRYASRNADILSCSWSGGTSPDVELALRDAAETGRNGLGTAVFCASGNDARNIVGFPASDPHAIAVGASTDKGEIADYSNRGPELSICAPSSGGTHGIYTTDVSILNRGFNLGDSTDKKGLFTDSFGGTSSATPLAAGVGALLLSVNPELSSVQLRERLESTADKIGSPEDYDGKGHSNTFGYGRVNAEKALG